METSAHPEVLAHDWLPPVLPGRARELAETVRRLDAPRPCAPPPWAVAVAGPSGSGTSALARRAARETVERIRAAGPDAPPRTLALRTARLRGAHGVATALLQRLDEGFAGHGFPVNEILAGFLRRVRRERRPTVLVLDDVQVGGPDLGPLLRALGAPDRFLPEGEFGLPPTWVVLAGTPEGLGAAERAVHPPFPVRPFVSLRPYDEAMLTAIVRDRFQRAIGGPPPDDWVANAVARSLEDGGGATRAIDLVRRRLVGAAARADPRFPRPTPFAVSIETHVVRAIGDATRADRARLADVKQLEARLARELGRRPLPATTLWRRIVALERAGYVRREVRPGGTGGTLSVVRLLQPIEEWVTAPGPWGTPRACVRSGGPDPGWTGAGREPADPPGPSGCGPTVA